MCARAATRKAMRLNRFGEIDRFQCGSDTPESFAQPSTNWPCVFVSRKRVRSVRLMKICPWRVGANAAERHRPSLLRYMLLRPSSPADSLRQSFSSFCSRSSREGEPHGLGGPFLFFGRRADSSSWISYHWPYGAVVRQPRLRVRGTEARASPGTFVM
jgi:hypothetical protein